MEIFHRQLYSRLNISKISSIGISCLASNVVVFLKVLCLQIEVYWRNIQLSACKMPSWNHRNVPSQNQLYHTRPHCKRYMLINIRSQSGCLFIFLFHGLVEQIIVLDNIFVCCHPWHWHNAARGVIHRQKLLKRGKLCPNNLLPMDDNS